AQTKREADALAHSAALQAAGVRPLHGDLPQELREATLRALRAGHLRVLVATDVAARGLDIPDVDLVVHYRWAASHSSLFSPGRPAPCASSSSLW
ncbi:unnamed protein product, partial [Heterosigma akashiwo]